MSPEEPRHGLGSTADHFAAYLDFYREAIIAGVLALDPAARRTPRVPSGWTPIELLSHVLHMEQRWFIWGFLGEEVAEPWGDWTVDQPWDDDADPDKRWYVADGVTAEDLAERLRDIGRRTTDVLRDHPLEETGRARRAVRRGSARSAVDLFPRASGVRPARRPPRHRGRAGLVIRRR